MNSLTFKTERVEIDSGPQWEIKKYLAFYYVIDGQKLEYENYNPAAACDILDEDAEEENIVILNHCTCGYWECDSIVARVTENADTVEWLVDNYRPRGNEKKYVFEKGNYFKTMSEIKTCARNERERQKNPLEVELIRLRKEKARLKLENEILRKAVVGLGKK